MAKIRTFAEFKDAGIRAYLSGLSQRHKQLDEKDRKVVAIMSAIVFRDVMDHFAQEQGPEGKWAPWSPKYRRHMHSIGKGGNKILQDSGRLRQSFNMAKWKTTGDGIVWFNNAKTKSGAPYAKIHDEGGKYHPQREFMFLSNKAVEDIEAALLKFLEG
jgi:phage gpG-like protein